MRLVGILLALTGWYAPAGYRNCEVSCATDGVCPDGFACDPVDQRCHVPGSTTCGDMPPDQGKVEDCVDLVGLARAYCPPKPVATMRVLDTSGSLSTDGDQCSDVLTQTDGPPICVIAATTVRVAASVNPKGTRPLLIVALDTLSVEKPIDVSEGGAGDAVPSMPACFVGVAQRLIASTTGSGGGGGGGFASPGGRGGAIVGG